MTALVVDDHDLVLDVITTILTTAGYRVLRARSVAEARSIISQLSIFLDLVVADVQLPDASGFVLARDLTHTRPHVPVLFTSGAYREVDAVVQHYLRPGRVFLEKPFTATTLLAKIADLVSGEGKGLGAVN